MHTNQFSFRLLMILVVLATIINSCTKKDNIIPTPSIIVPPPDFGFKVVSYFPYYRTPASSPDVKFRMANVIIYFGFTIDSFGSLILREPTKFNDIIAKSKANSARLFMGIGGAAVNFAKMAQTSEGRNSFVREIMNNIRLYSLSGVDIDWEYPSTQDGSDLTFTSLMKELSDSCHRNGKYYLTAAITAGKYPGKYRDAIRSELFKYVDWFHIMAYDDFNTTVPYKQHSDLQLAEVSLNYWLNTRSMPRNKCVLGFPAYGRPSGITQSGTVQSYYSIIGLGGNPLADSAVISVATYSKPYTIYYNGQPTVKKKTMLAKQLCNGIMMWEQGQDTDDATSLLKAVCDTLGRVY